jgi:ferredoxin
MLNSEVGIFILFLVSIQIQKNEKEILCKKAGVRVLKMSVKGDEYRMQILSSVSAKKNIFARTSCKRSQVCKTCWLKMLG